MFTCAAVEVTPSDTEDLAKPGTLFLDDSGTEGLVKVDLIDGGTVKLSLTKALCFANTCIVKKVYTTDTAASGILLNPISQ